MKTIYKYELDITDNPSIEMPKEAEILTIQNQNDKAVVWALVNPENAPEIRFFEVFGTGHDVPVDMGVERKYINTFQIGDFVGHLFERTN